MLSPHEQHAWEEITRAYPSDAAEEPVRTDHTLLGARGRIKRKSKDIPLVGIVGVWLGVLLILFGFPTAGAVLGLVIVFGWGLRFWWAEVRAADCEELPRRNSDRHEP